MAAGDHLLSAVYGGGSNYHSQSSGELAQQITQDTTTTALSRDITADHGDYLALR